jgi:nitronate monooxygenase
MARVATPELVAAVSGAGALGSLGGGMSTPEELRGQIEAVRRLTDAPFAVNLFAPIEPPVPDPGVVERMSELIEPWRERLGVSGAAPVGAVHSFEDQVAVVLEERPQVFSFTFGIPPPDVLSELREAGITIIGTATTVAEAVELEEAGCDAVVAQGSEAGGHRGTFAARVESALIGTVALVPQVVDRVGCPVIAAGGIMDGRGIAAALALGADGVQLGTAFIGCEESGAPPPYVTSLATSDESATKLTAAFTGRLARGLRTRFFDEIDDSGLEIPPFPLQQEMTMQLLPAGLARGELEVVIRLAGQGAPMLRSLPAARLVDELAREAAEVLSRLGSASTFSCDIG